MLLLGVLLTGQPAIAEAPSPELLAGHPRFSYEGVKNISEMEEALRKSLVAHERYSFSRSWWKWAIAFDVPVYSSAGPICTVI